jgi:hypothetical protein
MCGSSLLVMVGFALLAAPAAAVPVTLGFFALAGRPLTQVTSILPVLILGKAAEFRPPIGAGSARTMRPKPFTKGISQRSPYPAS